MARKRDPRREQAKQKWLESDGKKLLKEIAEELEVSDSQIRKWKSLDKWSDELKGNVTNSKGNVTNRGGAPLGNQNGKGNRGNSRASPPLMNKNALKTGEYETIFLDMFSDEEKEIYSKLSDDPSLILFEDIRLLKIRQRRMMQRIREAESDLSGEEVEKLEELRNFIIPVKRDGVTVELKQKRLTEVQVTRKQFRKIDTILSIEEALTRISAQLTRAVKQMNELTITDKKLILMDAQIDNTKVQTKNAQQKGDVNESTEDKLDQLLNKIGEEINGAN